MSTFDATSRRLRPLFVVGLVGLLSASVAVASGPSHSVLGQGGELLSLRSGPYGDLFTGQGGSSANTWVLALDVAATDGTLQRQLIPGSTDGRLETAPQLIPGAEGIGTILTWRSVRGDGRFELRFAALAAGESGPELSDVAAVSHDSGAVTFTEAPLMAVTRDSYGFDGEEGASEGLEGRYTLIHLLWRSGGDTPALRYTALTFVDGAYIGWHQVFDLGGLLQAPEGVEAGPALGSLADTLGLRIAADGRSLLVSAANPATGRLGTFEINALPLVLSVLGDQIREEIYGSADLFDPEDLVSFVDKVKGSIIAIGFRAHVHPAMSEYLSDRVGDWLETSGADYGYGDFLALGDDARDLAIDLSSSVYAATIEDPSAPGSTLVEINVGGVLGGDDSSPAQLLDLRQLTNAAAPVMPEGAEATLVPSSDGERLAIFWAVEGGVEYVESTADGAWSAVRQLPVEAADQAYGLLEGRLR